MKRPIRPDSPRYFADEIVFEWTGRTEYVHADIIGIDGAGSVFQGYDGTIEAHDYRETYRDEDYRMPSDPPPLTDVERRELAEEMVRRWKKWGGL